MASEITITISINPEQTKVTFPQSGIEVPLSELPLPPEAEEVEEDRIIPPPPEEVETAYGEAGFIPDVPEEVGGIDEETELIPPLPEEIVETEKEAESILPPSVESGEETRQTRRRSRSR